MKIKHNVPLSAEEQPRKAWPFAEMKVGDMVEVKEKKEWPHASKYAHNIASKKSWTMQTTWIESKKIGRIRRTA